MVMRQFGMKELPTAQEARKRQSCLWSRNAQQQLVYIIELINEAIDNEELLTWFNKPLIPGVKRILEENGYKVSQVIVPGACNNEVLVTIAW